MALLFVPEILVPTQVRRDEVRVPFQVPRDQGVPASVRQSGTTFPLEGRISWEAGAEPTPIDVELRGEDESTVINRTEATSSGRFRFDNVRYGTYWIIIESERYNYVRQRVIVDARTFGVIRVAVSLSPRTFEESGDPVSALRALRIAIPKGASEKYEDSLKAFQEDNQDQGIDRLKEALEIAPDFYDAYLDLGYAYQRAGDLGQAIASLKRAVEINPSSLDGLSWLGRLYYENEQFHEAADALSERIELGAASADDSLYIGLAYYKLGAYWKAEESFLRSVSISPETAGPVRLQLFNVYMRLRQPFKALEQIETYVSEYPDDPNLEAYQKRIDDLRKMLNRVPPPR